MDSDTKIQKTEKALTYKSNTIYTTIITLLFSLSVLVNIFIFYVSLILVNQIDEDVVSLFNALYLINFVLFIICGIFFLLWTYRASKNIHVLNPKYKFEFSPGWSIGAFFLPIFNLYWPYKVIKEIRAVSLLDEKKAKSKMILIVSWIAFLLQNILLRANAARNPLVSDRDIQNYFSQSIIITVFAIISALLAIIITRQINKAQKIRSQGLNIPTETIV